MNVVMVKDNVLIPLVTRFVEITILIPALNGQILFIVPQARFVRMDIVLLPLQLVLMNAPIQVNINVLEVLVRVVAIMILILV
jgi:hypothetical protein